MRPHRWNSPGKNTAVGCRFLLQCIQVKSESEVAQSCLTHHDPMDCSPPGSSIHGIFQARVLEWGATAFSGRNHSLLQTLTNWTGIELCALVFLPASVQSNVAGCWSQLKSWLIPRAKRIYSHLMSRLFKHSHHEELHYINLESCLVTQSCPTLCNPVDCSLPDSSVRVDSPGKNTGVSGPALLQGIFPTQGLNPGLPHHRQILYCLSHWGSPNLQLNHTKIKSY